MLDEVLNYLGWWKYPFSKDIQKIDRGKFTISSGILVCDAIEGQYIRITGSVLNDGVYQCPVTNLTDEVFEGEVWYLNLPKTLLDIVTEIEAYQTKNSASPYLSESFGGYSYSKAQNASGSEAGWQGAFGSRLKPYRKL